MYKIWKSGYTNKWGGLNMETIIKKLMNEDMTRTEALMFMRKITVNRLSLLTTIINRNASVYERLIDDLETIDKMIAERS